MFKCFKRILGYVYAFAIVNLLIYETLQVGLDEIVQQKLIKSQHVQLQINCFSEIIIKDRQIMFASADLDLLKNQNQILNLGAYSTDIMFQIFVDFFDTNQELKTIKNSLESNIRSKRAYIKNQFTKEKQQNSRFHHFTIYNRNQLLKSKILILFIGDHEFSAQNTEKQSKIVFSLSYNQFNLFQKHKGNVYQYYLKKGKEQNTTYEYQTREIKQKSQIKQQQDKDTSFWSFLDSKDQNLGFQFHTVHIVGEYQLSVILSYNQQFFTKAQGHFQSTKAITLITKHTDSTYYLQENFIQQKIDKIRGEVELQTAAYRMSAIKIKEIVKVTFSVKCMSKTEDCIFLNELNFNDSRQLIAGVPKVFSLQQEEVQLFYFKNSMDLNFNIKINRKIGIPHYMLCSTNNTNIKENQCTKLIKEKRKQDQFLIEAKEDASYFFGRGFELRITPHHEIYCYSCTYFIALFADFDNMQGSISIIHQNSYVLLPVGHSLVNIVSRHQPNRIVFYSGLQNIIFQRFQGDVFLKLSKILNKEMYNLTKILQEKSIQPKPFIQQQVIVFGSKTSQFLDLLNSFSTSFMFFEFYTYILTVAPLHNRPSLLYSVQTFSLETSRFMLKDGIPYNIEINSRNLINFKYLCEIENQNVGSITISSDYIDQLDIKVFGQCISSFDQGNQKNNNFGIFTKEVKNYQLTQKNYRKNIMVNRVDILIEAIKCKSYQIIIRGKKNQHQNQNIDRNKTQQDKIISYTILVSFLDSQLLPLNEEFPGILRYPSKLIQIYQIFAMEKISLSILINFCKAGSGRLMIYQNKNQIFEQDYIHMIQFTSNSQLKQLNYIAKPGVFYISIEFLGLSNILEYTILVKQNNLNYAMYQIFQQLDQKIIHYQVKNVLSQETVYQIQFYELQLQRLNQDHLQQDVNFKIQYYILQSNSEGFLTRAVNCKGQFFSDIMGHHEYFRQIKIEKSLMTYYPSKSVLPFGQKSKNGKYKYVHKTKNPFSYITIVPKVSLIQSQFSISGQNQHKFFSKNMIIPYWQYTESSRLPYRPTQLHNGKVYSVIQNLVQQILMFIEEEIIDIHNSQRFIILGFQILGVICFLYPLQMLIIYIYQRLKIYETQRERLRIQVATQRQSIIPIQLQQQQNFRQEDAQNNRSTSLTLINTSQLAQQ